MKTPLTEREFIHTLRWKIAMTDVPRFARHVELATRLRYDEGQRGSYRVDQRTGRFVFVHDTSRAIHAN